MEEMIKVIIVSLFGGGAIGSIALFLIQKKYNKKKEDIELAVQYQDFYRKEIASREKDKKELSDELDSIKQKISNLVSQNEVLIKRVVEGKKTIKEKSDNIKRWEKYCDELKRSVKDSDKTNALLIKEIESLEKGSEKE